jgi:hypothetical protein
MIVGSPKPSDVFLPKYRMENGPTIRLPLPDTGALQDILPVNKLTSRIDVPGADWWCRVTFSGRNEKEGPHEPMDTCSITGKSQRQSHSTIVIWIAGWGQHNRNYLRHMTSYIGVQFHMSSNFIELQQRRKGGYMYMHLLHTQEKTLPRTSIAKHEWFCTIHV